MAAKIRFSALLFLLAMLTSCDSQRLQDDFAADASRAPSGYTSTDRNGGVRSTDEDDWRISPLYAGKVRVEPAYPNPTTGETVIIPVSILEFNGVSGVLSLRTRRGDGRLVVLDQLNDTAPGTYLLSFPPALIGGSGLLRVFLFDSAGEIVSYGDILFN